MKALIAMVLAIPCAATTFTPCPRSIDAPPITLTIINTQTPGVECARRATEADYGAAVRKCWEGRA